MPQKVAVKPSNETVVKTKQRRVLTPLGIVLLSIAGLFLTAAVTASVFALSYDEVMSVYVNLKRGQKAKRL